MSSQDDRDFDELLRRLLHEEADLVEPGADALEQIRARLGRPRPPALAWVTVAAPGWFRRALGRRRPVGAWLRKVAGGAYARFLAAVRVLRRWRRPAVLTLALGVAVAAGVLALTPLPRQAVAGTAALFRSLEGHGAAGGRGGQAVAGSGTSPLPTGRAVPTTRPGSHQHRPTPSPRTTTAPSPKPTPCLTPAAGPSPEASPSPGPSPAPAVRGNAGACPSPSASSSPAPTATPTPTPTPSPTPTPTPDPAPTAGPTPTGDPTTAPAADPTPAPAADPIPAPATDPIPAPATAPGAPPLVPDPEPGWRTGGRLAAPMLHACQEPLPMSPVSPRTA